MQNKQILTKIMKFNILSLSLSLGTAFILFTSARDPNNPPTAKTGAPGETTCAQSGCHTGGTFTGTVTVTGVPDTVLFGHVYPVTITNASNAARAGFELTCLDSLKVKCGVLTSAAGVNVTTSAGRQYARQSAPKNLSGGSASWTFNWTAPATAGGNKGTFYFVSLCSNNNGQKTGDNVLVNSKPIVFTQVSPTAEPKRSVSFKLYPSEVSDLLHVDLLDAQTGKMYVFNASGALMLQQNIEANNAINVAAWNTGTYLVKVETTSGSVVRKFVKY